MKTIVLALVIGIAITFLWHDRREETFKFRNPFRMKPNLTKNLTPSDTMKGFGTGVKPKPGAVGGGADPWMKAGTIFGGLDLALMPLWFIPMGGGGDTGGDGEAAGAAAQDPTSSISSSSSSSSSLLMLMMLVVLVLVAAT